MPCSQPTCVPVRRRCSRSQSTSDSARGRPRRCASRRSPRRRWDRALLAHRRRPRGVVGGLQHARGQHAGEMPPVVGAGVDVGCRVERRPRRHARRSRSVALSEPRADEALRRARETRAASVPPPPTPKAARVQRPSSSSATCARGGDDREVAVAAADLGERRAGLALAPDRPVDFRRGIRPAASAVVIAAYEERRPPAACACRTCVRSDHARAPSTCATSGNSADGIGMREAAADGAAVARLHVADPCASACRSSGTRAASASSRCDLALARAGAHAHGIGFERDEFQRARSR